MMTVADFPLTIKNIEYGRLAVQFDAALKVLNDFSTNKISSVSTTTYDSVRYAVSTSIERALQSFGRSFDLHTLPKDVSALYWNITPLEIRNIAKRKQMVDNSAISHPLITLCGEFLAEILPLSSAMADLKAGIVKRTRGVSTEPVVTKYVPPLAASATLHAVHDMLTKLCQDSADAMEVALCKKNENQITAFLTALSEAGKKRYSPHIFFFERKGGVDLTMLQIVFDNKNVLVSDWKSKLKKYVSTSVKEQLDQFVLKTMRKLASIIEGKQSIGATMTEYKILGHHVNLYSLDGAFKFTFDDGSSFASRNSMVWSYSSRGTPFVRFPLTFHDAKLPGGINMKNASEERMNTVFVGKDKAVDLAESPIEDLTHVGDWDRNSSFRNPQDRKLLTNTKAVEKIIAKWSNTVVPFNIFLVNSPEAGRHIEVGKVDHAWLEKNMPKTLPSLTIKQDAVNVIYTNNNGAERMPMTAWVMAHRFGHVVRDIYDFKQAERDIEEIIKIIAENYFNVKSKSHLYYDPQVEKYEQFKRGLLQAIGTFKSARDGQIKRTYEFNYEVFAQYLITGHVKFNPLPAHISYGRMAWGKPTQYAHADNSYDADYFNSLLYSLAESLENTFENLLHSCVGKIFVM